MRRVLDPTLKLGEQILLLLASKTGRLSVSDLLDWTGYENKSYFMKTLRDFHSKRLVEMSKDENLIEILPPGASKAADIVARATLSI